MSKYSKISLEKAQVLKSVEVYITGSKSESNRALILNALSENLANIHNLSNARDTRTMSRLLASSKNVLDVMDAGTTMRFLTAYFAATNQSKILTGTPRMKERPIAVLVEALTKIGADISYVEEEGYPPVRTSGFKNQKENKISIRGDVSSQYISALLMIAPNLPKGLTLKLEGSIGSKPYIEMTLGLMEKFGIHHKWDGNEIHISQQPFTPVDVRIEPDWSGASYWYAFMALAEEAIMQIPGLKSDSFQGDSIMTEIGEKLGVITSFSDEGVVLAKTGREDKVEIDFTHCPDLAQTVAVICAAGNIKGEFTGLKSLRIKETDRILALQTELQKINADLVSAGEDKFELIPSDNIPTQALFDTYEDHRMAMAFAPLSTKMDLEILDPNVVDKSYPEFWKEVEKVGVKTSFS